MNLVERDQQLRLLADAWDQVRAGKGRLALVSGEAGIGKTALLDHFVRAQAQPAQVLWGACDALFSPQPLGPFIEIAVQIQSGLPQFAPPGTARSTFSTDFFVYLQKNAGPSLVVLEDLHWADEATLDVVKFLGRRLQHTRTLLILTYRDDEVSSRHPLSLLLGDFPSHLTTRIALPVLSPAAVDRLAQQANRRLEGLYRVTGGNPFFVTEIIASDSEGAPRSVRDAVLGRVARLSPAAREIVELAALMPGTAEEWLIHTILQPAPGALDECEERGILHAKENSLAFRHELARQSVEDSLPIGRTRDLHAKILAALLHAGGGRMPLTRLVHHAAGAGDEAATLRFAPEAARQASALSAHREASALYASALRYKHRLTPEAQAELLESLSYEDYLIDKPADAIVARQEATHIWQRLGHQVRAGDCQRWLSRFYWAAGDGRNSEKYAELAIETLLDLPPGPELAMAFSNKSQLLMLAWKEYLSIEWGQRAIELAEKLGAVETVVHALTNVGSSQLMIDYATGRATLERALRIALERDLYDHVSRCYTNLASYCVQTRRYPDAQYWLERGLEYTTVRDLDLYSVYIRGWHGAMCFEMGDWAAAEASAVEALRLSRFATIVPIPSLTTLGHLKVRQGDPTAAAFLDRAQALALRTGELQRIGPLAVARAEAAWLRGDLAGVITEAGEAYALAVSRHDPWILGELALWMWRAGTRDVPVERLAAPYALMVRGEWRRAAEAWARQGCPYEQALSLAEGTAAEQLQALQIYERLGAQPAAKALRAQLQAQGVTRPPTAARPAKQAAADDLTPRELEVLRLMAEGLSNPALAKKLTISVGTVKAHTASIYSKLGVNNRVLALSRAKELRLL